MVAAFVVPGMTIIDGIVRTQRTRNTPPAGEGAGDRGTAAVDTARAFTSPDLRGEVEFERRSNPGEGSLREPISQSCSRNAAPQPTVFP